MDRPTTDTGSSVEDLPKTLGELRATGYRPRSVKEELRVNIIHALREGRELFPGIIGFEKTVVPQVVNGILAKHDFVLLGLRGQAKTRIARQLVNFLDPYTPVLPGLPLNEDPLWPISEEGRERVQEEGDDTAVEWLSRDRRYGEKLATPDVSVADLIGDIDPIKAANLRLEFSSEKVIHYGIIPRTNRGIFCINELPDLAARIQVGLLNIMQERDIQIRGFPVRLPIDTMMIYTANPEDYTNRGAIITPLKDRIESQIHTHYPQSLEEAMVITRQEAWVDRRDDVEVHVPRFLLEAVEEVAFAARQSEFLDQSSGVSARLPITLLENMVSNAERRGLACGERKVCARPVDLQPAVSAITGKVELVYQGEQEGAVNVARHLVGRGLKAVFDRLLPAAQDDGSSEGGVFGPYKPIIDYFGQGNRVQIGDMTDVEKVRQTLPEVPTLQKLAERHVPLSDKELELPAAMEFVIEGLHQAKILGKDEVEGVNNYYDMLGDILGDIDTRR